MPHNYKLSNSVKGFIHVTPSVELMRSTTLQKIVMDDDRQLVVNLDTGLLTVHNKPKPNIPKEVVVFFHYEDTYVILPHDVEAAITRVNNIGRMGNIAIKDKGLAITVMENRTNFARAMRTLYKSLAA